MEAYIREHYEPTRDPVTVHALMRICRLMHDSVNALSVDDEVRNIGSLISNGLVRAVSFGSDLDQQLAFLVECRAAFCNIDPVLQHLVHSVNHVTVQLHRAASQSVAAVYGRGSGSFARACAAFAFITIPSLNGVFHRLALYLESGQVKCHFQPDAVQATQPGCLRIILRRRLACNAGISSDCKPCLKKSIELYSALS